MRETIPGVGAEEHGTGEDGTGGHGTGGRGPTHSTGNRSDSRSPWAWLVGGLVALGVVAVVLVLGYRGAPEPVTPEAQVVTLPPPTPTVEPIDPGAGTAFFGALPRTVLSYALTEAGEHPPLLAAGALEGYRLVYGDGTTTLTVHAGQWRDAAGAEAALADVVALEAPGARDVPAGDLAGDREEPRAGDHPQDGEEPEDGATGSPSGPGLQQGPVEVGGEQVGRYLLLTRADGTGSLWWTNSSVLLQAEGPADALRDVYAAFPI